ncbi:hypothetical protein JCM18909_611 [Cutibacterium acnes JCM 18909]|nr:hypothetical protein JCM18909_611 [Cutibacterium acnes JCM 18909]
MVVLTDAQAHLDVLDTPGLLATATREGRLPPVIAVFLSTLGPTGLNNSVSPGARRHG